MAILFSWNRIQRDDVLNAETLCSVVNLGQCLNVIFLVFLFCFFFPLG